MKISLLCVLAFTPPGVEVQASAQESTALVSRLQRAALLPDMGWELAEDDFIVSEDGWVGARLRDGIGVVRHLPTGREIRTPEGVTVEAMRFRPGHDEVWFAVGASGMLVARLPNPAIDLAAPETAPLEFAPLELTLPAQLDYAFDGEVNRFEFSSDGWAFAWSTKEVLHVVLGIGIIEEMRVTEHWSESKRFEHLVDFPFSNTSLPPFQFARGGRSLIFTHDSGEQSATGSKGEGIGRVYDLQTQKILSHFRPYVCRKSRGWALTPDQDSVLFASREQSSDWSIQRLMLSEPGGRVTLDSDARGRHFIDLFVDQSGRWLAESDHEERGVRLYDLKLEQSPLLLGTRDLVGLVEGEGDEDPLLVTGAEKGPGYAAWSVHGEPVLERIEALPEKRYTGLKVTGEYLLCTGWSSPEGSLHIDYFLDVLRLGENE